MLIDSTLVFSDSQAITATTDSQPVSLIGFSHPGHMNPLPVLARVTQAFDNCTSLTLELLQSRTRDGEYTPVPGSAHEVPQKELAKEGKGVGWRFLPGPQLPWLKIRYTVTGAAPSKGRIFAAIVREDALPYVSGMYVDAGVIKG